MSKQKSIILVALLVAIVALVTMVNQPISDTSRPVKLSEDQKSILTDDGELLVDIINESIINWFRTESFLCDTANDSRKKFCTDETFFREQTRFVSIHPASSQKYIGMVIQTEELTPDTVVGIMDRTKSPIRVRLLTSYYLSSDFLGFSPDDRYYAYQGGCFELACNLLIGRSDDQKVLDLSEEAGLYADERNFKFSRWISDSAFEYTDLGKTKTRELNESDFK